MSTRLQASDVTWGFPPPTGRRRARVILRVGIGGCLGLKTCVDERVFFLVGGECIGGDSSFEAFLSPHLPPSGLEQRHKHSQLGRPISWPQDSLPPLQPIPAWCARALGLRSLHNEEAIPQSGVFCVWSVRKCQHSNPARNRTKTTTMLSQQTLPAKYVDKEKLARFWETNSDFAGKGCYIVSVGRAHAQVKLFSRIQI